MDQDKLDFELVCAARNQLGESGRFDKATGQFDWVDIPRKALHSLSPEGRHTQQPIESEPGFAVRTDDGHRLVGAEDRLMLLDGTNRSLGINGVGGDTRINDGAVHPDGTCVVFGALHQGESESVSGMWIAGNDVRRLPYTFIVFNGPAFSLAGDRIYFADSPHGIIWTAPFDRKELSLGERSVFARVEPENGLPDGMIVDDEDHLWSAHWDGWRLTRYRPDGSIDRVIKTPVARPTSVAFAGPDRRRLVVTSAALDSPSEVQSPGEISHGDVFSIDVGVSGPPNPRLHNDRLLALFTED